MTNIIQTYNFESQDEDSGEAAFIFFFKDLYVLMLLLTTGYSFSTCCPIVLLLASQLGRELTHGMDICSNSDIEIGCTKTV